MTNTITPLAVFDDNYIWCIANTQQKKVAVVDPGDGLAVLDWLEAGNYQLNAVMVTHHHYDHTGGIATLLERYPDIAVFGGSNSPCELINRPLIEGDTINVLEQTFSILHLPGHTLDHIAYYDANEQQLFCGDTLFLAGCGRVFEGTMEQMHLSLNKLMALPENTLAYPTHEYSLANLAFASAVEPENSDIKAAINKAQYQRQRGLITLPTQLTQEALINPFVRCHMPDVIMAAQQRVETKLNTQEQIFSTLREWKNNF